MNPTENVPGTSSAEPSSNAQPKAVRQYASCGATGSNDCPTVLAMKCGRVEIKGGRVSSYAFEQTDIADGSYLLHAHDPQADAPGIDKAERIAFESTNVPTALMRHWFRKGYSAARQELTDGQIRDVFMKNGFTVKDGHDDLKPYVYAAARELLALAAKHVD